MKALIDRYSDLSTSPCVPNRTPYCSAPSVFGLPPVHCGIREVLLPDSALFVEPGGCASFEIPNYA